MDFSNCIVYYCPLGDFLCTTRLDPQSKFGTACARENADWWLTLLIPGEQSLSHSNHCTWDCNCNWAQPCAKWVILLIL